jgi:hypothetical protein
MTSTLSGKGTKQRRRSLPILPILSILSIILALGVFGFELIRFTQAAERLAPEITVAGVEVGGMPAEQAVASWEQAYAQPVLLYYDDSPILLDPGEVGFRMNSEVMFATARSTIEAGSDFWLRFFNYLVGQQAEQSIDVPLDATYQESSLEQYLNNLALRYDRPPGTPTYDVQTLTFRAGAEGHLLDVDAAIPLIEAALHSPNDRTVVLPLQDAAGSDANINALRDLIIDYLDSQGFIYDGQSTVASVFVLDLQTGEEVNILGDVTFSAASTIKVSILIDYFRTLLFAPSQDEAWLMANSLLCSNNSSSNLMMQIIGERQTGRQDIYAGIADVTNTANLVGARNTYITAPLYLGVPDQELGSIPAPATSPNPNFSTNADIFNQTTTEDLGTMFNMIYDCANYGSGLMAAYPDGEFTQQECRQMIELMSANDLLRLIQGGVPPGTRISHKNGWLNDVHGDAGIVFPPNGHDYIIAVFVWEEGDFFTFDRAWPLVEGISRATWNYFVPEDPLLAPRADLPPTAQECEGNFLPPGPDAVNLDNINGWRAGTQP